MSFQRPTLSSNTRSASGRGVTHTHRIHSLRPAPRPIIPASEMPQQNEVQRRSTSAVVVAPVTITLPNLAAIANSAASGHHHHAQPVAPRSRLATQLSMSSKPTAVSGGAAAAASSSSIQQSGSRYAFTSGGRRLKATSSELDTVQRLGSVLESLNRKVLMQIEVARREAGGAAAASGGGSGGLAMVGPERMSLVHRALELNKRLEVLKQKLRVATEYYTAEQAQLDELRLNNQAYQQHLRQQQQRLTSSASSSPAATTTTTTTTIRGNSIAVRSTTTVDPSCTASNPQEWQVVLQKLEEDPSDAPRDFVCPISQCVMVDPVRTCDGHSYDRSSIAEWFQTFDDHRMPTSPMTNLPLASLELTPDDVLREQILAYLREVRQQNGSNSKSKNSGNSDAASASSSLSDSAHQAIINKHQHHSVVQESGPSLRDAPKEAVVRNTDDIVAAAAALTAPTSPKKQVEGHFAPRVPGSEHFSSFHAPSASSSFSFGGLAPAPPQPSSSFSFSSTSNNSNNNNNTRGSGAGPIWSSAIVPSSEPHARALNLLRLDETIELPHFASASSSASSSFGGGGGGVRPHGQMSAVAMAAAALGVPVPGHVLGSSSSHQRSAGAVAASASTFQRRQQVELGLPQRSSDPAHVVSNGAAPRSLNDQRRVPSSSSARRK